MKGSEAIDGQIESWKKKAVALERWNKDGPIPKISKE